VNPALDAPVERRRKGRSAHLRGSATLHSGHCMEGTAIVMVC
jgi:hypothetical protein